MLKSDLRRVYKNKRRSLDLNVRHELDQGILANFQKLDLSGIRVAHIYLPIESQAEPDTYGLIGFLQESFSHIKIAVSKSDFHSGEMKNYLFDRKTKITINAWGIPEPEAGIEIHPQMIDLVVLPLLIVDQLGNRVGYGQGFYDRFLSSCREDVKTVGLCYFEPVPLITDIHEKDIAIQRCVTATNIYSFG